MVIVPPALPYCSQKVPGILGVGVIKGDKQVVQRPEINSVFSLCKRKLKVNLSNKNIVFVNPLLLLFGLHESNRISSVQR